MGSPIIFSGNDAKLLKSNLDFFGQSKILSGTVDPSSVATSAPIGSLYLNSSSGLLYRKTDAGSSTNWAQTGSSAVVTAWTAYTPTFTGFGTVSTQDFKWRQVGESIEVQGSFTCGTATATEARISLPGSFTAASDYVTLECAGFGCDTADTGTQTILIEPSVTYMTMGKITSTVAGLVKQNGNQLITTGARVSIVAAFRVQGLGGTVPIGYLPISAKYTGSATSISGSLATVVWATSVFDTSSAMSSGVFTVPAGMGGKYQVNANIQVTGTIALNSVLDMVLQQNNSTVSEFQEYAGGAMTAQNGQISDLLNCSAGDTIRIQVSSSATLPAITNSSKTFISIIKVSS